MRRVVCVAECDKAATCAIHISTNAKHNVNGLHVLHASRSQEKATSDFPSRVGSEHWDSKKQRD
jgi:hypothetical protein